MKIAGEATLGAPVAQVWDALLDPRVLVRTIPGCEQLEQTGDNAYKMTVTAGVAAIKGTYSGTCQLSDLVPHESLVMALQGAGAPGTIGATVNVGFVDNGATTTLKYDADAVVGGMVGGVGQRMLTSVSRRMAAEFFGNVERAVVGGVSTSLDQPTGLDQPGALDQPAGPGAVFTAPARAATGGLDQDSFLKGVALGAGLVLVGVVVGGIFGRRR